jgi:hypothetical protein
LLDEGYQLAKHARHSVLAARGNITSSVPAQVLLSPVRFTTTRLLSDNCIDRSGFTESIGKSEPSVPKTITAVSRQERFSLVSLDKHIVTLYHKSRENLPPFD